MEILIKYSKEFANCNGLFYKLKINLGNVYSAEYIKNLEKIEFGFKSKFYDVYSTLLDSVLHKKAVEISNYDIEELLYKYKFVITKLQHIYEYNTKQNNIHISQMINSKTR